MRKHLGRLHLLRRPPRNQVRASAFSLLMGSLAAAQALAAVLAGMLADVVGIGPAMALAALPAVAAGALHFAVPVRRPLVITLPDAAVRPALDLAAAEA